MKKVMNKRGQFYLIATIILVTIIASFAAITNYSSKTNLNPYEELAKGLRIEGEKVLDYDEIHSTNRFDEFARDYSDYVGSEVDIYFIVGRDSIQAFRYDGTTKNNFDSYLDVDDEIVFTLEEIDYKFKLEEGINFYFIFVYLVDGEKYILTG